MNLSFKDNFIIKEEHDNVAVNGTLKCNCGAEKFTIYHTGKQTKGILSPHIKKIKNQILIEAKCPRCGQTIKIYDTNTDGEKPSIVTHPEQLKFIHKNIDEYKVKIYLNYYEENYMTNKFAMIYIYLFDDNNKQIVLYEE